MTSVRFDAVVESAKGGGHAVEVDRALAERIGARHMTRVRGTLDGTEYRSNVASMGGAWSSAFTRRPCRPRGERPVTQ